MKRTQLYLDDELWKALHVHSRQSGLSISELARKAIRERYLDGANQRRKAMMAIVGIRKDRTDLPPTETYIRQLRKGARRRKMLL